MLVVAIIALRNPKGHSTAEPTKTVMSTVHSSPSTPAGGSSSSSSSSASSSTSSSLGSSSGSTSDTTSGTPANVKSVPLIVLNNTTISHLAEDATQRFERGGWTVTSYANYQNDILSTCAYYDPSSPGAQAAAEALQQQYPTIQRVKPRFPQLPAGPVVVVLTPDYSPN